MFKLKSVSASAAVFALCSNAIAAPAPNDQDKTLAQIEALWAKLPEKDRAQFIARIANAGSTATARKPLVDPKQLTTKAAPTRSPPVAEAGANNAAAGGGCSGFQPVLRKNWTDIDLTQCPQLVNNATGAVLSYSSDQIKGNNVWTAQGTAALIYNQMPTANSFLSTGVYGSLDKVTNSALTSKGSNVDTSGFGGFIQYGVVNDGAAYSANYFRLRAGVAADNIKSTTNANVVAEWIPVYYDPDSHISIHNPIELPGTVALVRFDPEIMAQYVEVTGKNQVTSFNNRAQALPIGPELTLRFYPGAGPSTFWSQLVGPTISYWWAYDAYSSHPISWLDASIGYNITTNGNVALTFSYERGNDVNNGGTLTNMYLISLSAKL